MNEQLLINFETNGLPCPFYAKRSGETLVTQKCGTWKNEISQTALLIFETIGAIGEIKIEKMELIGNKKGVIMTLETNDVLGCLFEFTKDVALDDYWRLLNDLKVQSAVVVEPKKKAKMALAPSILDQMKLILKDYLGDFTERIYQNQLNTQQIKVEELYEEDARRFILALSRATTMIVGRSKGREVMNKLLELLK